MKKEVQGIWRDGFHGIVVGLAGNASGPEDVTMSREYLILGTPPEYLSKKKTFVCNGRAGER